MPYGDIGIEVNFLPLKKKVPYWLPSNTPGLYTIDTSGYITGTVKKEGNNVANAPVRLYYRPNGVLIETSITDSSGNFSFDNAGLNISSSDYYVVALSTTSRSTIEDLVTPQLRP